MMTLKQIYDLSIELGMKRGVRAKKEFDQSLKKLREEYNKLDEKKKAYFDMESLKNPFLDSRVEYGDPGVRVKRALVGIDIAVGELMLAKSLSDGGKKIDAVLSHHPEGRSLLGLTQVMELQHDTAVSDGVPINVIEKLMKVRILDLDRAIHAINHFQVPDAAKLLNIPFGCLHTVADNQCYWFIKNYISKKKNLKTVGDVIEALCELPEFDQARKMGNGPLVFVGDEKASLGKISYGGFTGGTSGPKDAYEKMANAGVGTLLAMHIPEEHRKLCEKNHLNVLITGHMASDSLGMNLLLDEFEKRGVEIVPCGGLLRVSRTKKRLF